MPDAGSTQEYRDTWVRPRSVGRAQGTRAAVVAGELARAARQGWYTAGGLRQQATAAAEEEESAQQRRRVGRREEERQPVPESGDGGEQGTEVGRREGEQGPPRPAGGDGGQGPQRPAGGDVGGSSIGRGDDGLAAQYASLQQEHTVMGQLLRDTQQERDQLRIERDQLR